MVDIERLLVVMLRADTDVDGQVGDRIWVQVPDDATRPACRLVLSGGTANTSDDPSDWITDGTVQVDAWGTTKLEAFDAIDTIRSVLLAAPRTQPVQTHGEIVRTRATVPQYIPDNDWPTDQGQDGPRYTMTVRVRAHPTRS